jgi:hypothetical protein
MDTHTTAQQIARPGASVGATRGLCRCRRLACRRPHPLWRRVDWPSPEVVCECLDPLCKSVHSQRAAFAWARLGVRDPALRAKLSWSICHAPR